MEITKEDYKAEVQYESNGKTPDGNSFLTVKKARGYYEYSERGGKDSIAFILIDKNKEKYCLIDESKPPLDESLRCKVMLTTAFGGSIDMDKTQKEICQIEVLEEAGYGVPLQNIHFVGKTLVSSQMSQICYLYAIDVTGFEKTHLTEFEKVVSEDQNKKDPSEFSNNSLVWMSLEEVMENNDWKSIFIITKAMYAKII